MEEAQLRVSTWKTDQPFLSWIWLIIKPNKIKGTAIYCEQNPPDQRSLFLLHICSSIKSHRTLESLSLCEFWEDNTDMDYRLLNLTI